MAEVTDDVVRKLRDVRGEFENSKSGRMGNRVLAHVFSTVFPLVFVYFLIFWSGMEWPPTGENWLFMGFALLTCVTGVFFHRTINSRYVFDGEGVREFGSSGKLKHFIRWHDLTKIEYRESRGIKTFILIGRKDSLRLELYKSLAEALENA